MTHHRIELILVNYWNSNLLLCRYVFYQSNQHLILRNAWFTAHLGWNGPHYSVSSTSCVPENLYCQRPKSEEHQLRSHFIPRKMILRQKNAKLKEGITCTLNSLLRNGDWSCLHTLLRSKDQMLIPPNSHHYFRGQSANSINYKTQTSGHALLLKTSVYVIKLTTARADEQPRVLHLCEGTPEVGTGRLDAPCAKGKVSRLYKRQQRKLSHP